MADRDVEAGLVLGLLLGGVVAVVIFIGTNKGWEKECIKHRAAHHDSITGEFTWNDEVEKK